MKNLSLLEYFAAVGKGRSFSKAAIALGVPKSTVSRKIKLLEEDLGVLLIQRNPRQFELTDQGLVLLQSTESILQKTEEAFDEVRHAELGLRGSIHISTTADLAQLYLAEASAKFVAENTSVNLVIDVTPTRVDLIRDRIDLAIRVGPLQDSGLYARKLQDREQGFFASVDYIKRFGRPKTIDDLKSHAFLSTSRLSLPGILIAPAVQANNMSILRQMILSGTGIGLVDADSMVPDKKSGKVVQILTQNSMPKVPIFMVFPNKKMSKRVAKLVEKIFEQL